jgi:hypothetical protein
MRIQDLNSQATASADHTIPKKGKGKAKLKAPLSEADVRRSLRLKKINNGFKSSSCKDKNCLGCSSMPPTFSTKVIRNLGATFCSIDPQELSTSKLSAKPVQKKKKAVIRKKKGQSSENSQDNSTSGKDPNNKPDDDSPPEEQSSKLGAANPSS